MKFITLTNEPAIQLKTKTSKYLLIIELNIVFDLVGNFLSPNDKTICSCLGLRIFKTLF